jgi:hypothetical protein
MTAVYIGEDFYHKSGTIMSSLYKILPKSDPLQYIRTDWGYVQVALRQGEEVHIRPATEDELKYFEIELEELIKRIKESDMER